MSFDRGSLDDVIGALYASISFEVGGRPDTRLLRSLFARHPRLVHAEPGDVQAMSLDDFVERLEERVGNPMVAFRERELCRKVDRFGCIAHVFSTFEAAFELRGQREPQVVRGINSIQLRRLPDRWLVTSILWANESDEQSIPGGYLPRT